MMWYVSLFGSSVWIEDICRMTYEYLGLRQDSAGHLPASRHPLRNSPTQEYRLYISQNPQQLQVCQWEEHAQFAKKKSSPGLPSTGSCSQIHFFTQQLPSCQVTENYPFCVAGFEEIPECCEPWKSISSGGRLTICFHGISLRTLLDCSSDSCNLNPQFWKHLCRP